MVLRTAVALALAVVVAACSARDVVRTPGGPKDAEEVIAKVDWERAVTRTLRIRQNAFYPAFLSLRRGSAYILTFENGDDVTHAFLAPEFFESIAVKSLVPVEEPLPKASTLVSIKLAPGESRELSFVAVRDGYYRFEDGVPGFFLDGLQLAPISRGSFGVGGAIAIQ